ncbi:MAG: MmgE/PrpD family protein [Rhodobacteraceae bacterium]|nr:MmgE/PrpD family protein [Paracoccaceae bacterium]
MTRDLIDFIHGLDFADIPPQAQQRAMLSVLDLVGVGIAGAETRLSGIIRDHACGMFQGQTLMLFDHRTASPAGVALAGGMTIDAFDAHDGFNQAKGHVGCGLFPAVYAIADAEGIRDGREFLTSMVIGYELGARLAMSLHASAPDYHSSGAWVAVAVAAVGARLLRLDAGATRHAMGIAEYHGPRSQMMRCIDTPSMVKDGSGFGAMAGVSAAYLAKAGFTGAPAITAEAADVARFWYDLGDNWLITRQYYKPYPVCRWAQAPIEAVLELRSLHHLKPEMVDHIEIETFHESVRLAVKDPKTTEQAQYSTSYPCAVALVRGNVGAFEISEAAFGDPEVSRLSNGLKMSEDDFCNQQFPAKRHARAILYLRDGRVLTSRLHQPGWDAENPPGWVELQAKFQALAEPLIGPARAAAINAAVMALDSGGSMQSLASLLCRPNRQSRPGAVA